MRGCGASSDIAAVLTAALLFLVCTLLSGCAGARRGEIPPGPPLSREPLPGSDRVYPSQDPGNQASPGAADAFPAPGGSRAVPGAVEAAPVPGVAREPAGPVLYQVQVFASGSVEAARNRAIEIAEMLHLPVRVIREGGLHLVRVGEEHDIGEAERLKRLAVDLGYRDAMVVESRTAR